MGLFLDFDGVPTPRLTGRRNHADHRLAARMDVDVFDRDLFLPHVVNESLTNNDVNEYVD
jgi:hypothetical protein